MQPQRIVMALLFCAVAAIPITSHAQTDEDLQQRAQTMVQAARETWSADWSEADLIEAVLVSDPFRPSRQTAAVHIRPAQCHLLFIHAAVEFDPDPSSIGQGYIFSTDKLMPLCMEAWFVDLGSDRNFRSNADWGSSYLQERRQALLQPLPGVRYDGEMLLMDVTVPQGYIACGAATKSIGDFHADEGMFGSNLFFTQPGSKRLILDMWGTAFFRMVPQVDALTTCRGELNRLNDTGPPDLIFNAAHLRL
jgi:hypothetical protein